jgi:hypothetical protein
VGRTREDGYEPVVVPDNIRKKLRRMKDANAVSGAPDISLEFEQALTDYLGTATSEGLLT